MAQRWLAHATEQGAGVARFKWPERLQIVAELPVTKMGKLDKKALREILAAPGGGQR